VLAVKEVLTVRVFVVKAFAVKAFAVKVEPDMVEYTRVEAVMVDPVRVENVIRLAPRTESCPLVPTRLLVVKELPLAVIYVRF